MRKFKEVYNEKKMSVKESLNLIKDRDYIFCAQAAGEPTAILNEMQYLKETGVKGAVLNTCLPIQDYPVFKDPEMKGILDENSWFFSKSLREAHKMKLASAIPQHSTTVLQKRLDRNAFEGRRNVVIATVSPMDEHGFMSLSISAIYERDLIDKGAMPIVEVNPNFPRTFGDTHVHISEVAALVESDRPIPEAKFVPYTDVDAKIGKYIGDLVEDGSTIQLGVGNIPNAVAAELKTKKHLGIHTEMFTEAMVDLIECGAVDNSQKGLYNGFSVCSFTLGSKKLYDYINNNPSVLFKSCTFTNDPYTIGLNNKFVSINAALEVDLMGQCASETVDGVQWSGSGGQAETVQGSQRSKGGKSFIAMHSSYVKKDENGVEKRYSKIVSALHKNAAVTTSRNDVDYVVTEYGVAWLRGLNIAERVEALIKIAHPDFREQLKKEAEENRLW